MVVGEKLKIAISCVSTFLVTAVIFVLGGHYLHTCSVLNFGKFNLTKPLVSTEENVDQEGSKNTVTPATVTPATVTTTEQTA